MQAFLRLLYFVLFCFSLLCFALLCFCLFVFSLLFGFVFRSWLLLRRCEVRQVRCSAKFSLQLLLFSVLIASKYENVRRFLRRLL